MKKILIFIFLNTVLVAYTQNNLPIIEEKIDVKEELTEEKLLEIIKIAENSPEPESSVEIDENIQEQQFLTSNGEDRLHFESEYSALVKNYYDFLDSLNSEIKEYEFEDKTKVVPIKNEISKELTSEKLIEDFEIGVGVKYQGQRDERYRFDEEQSGIGHKNRTLSDENSFGNIPVYATGKYNFSTPETGAKPYLKLNLGYYIEGVENRESELSKSEYTSLNRSMEYENGRYYGIGGGVEYKNGLTFDVMYQINKNKDREERAGKEDRITFSVEYKLDLWKDY